MNTLSLVAVPEPATAAMLSFWLFAMAAIRRRRSGKRTDCRRR